MLSQTASDSCTWPVSAMCFTVLQIVAAGPVNLPPEGLPGLHRPLRKQGSYQWLMDACEDQASDMPAAERGGCSCSAPYQGLRCSFWCSFEVCRFKQGHALRMELRSQESPCLSMCGC